MPPRDVADSEDERKPFQRKRWDELSDAWRSKLESKGQTAERHNAGLPPPRAGDDPPKRGAVREPEHEPDELRGELERMLTQVGALVMMIDRFDGMVIAARAGEAADSLADLAATRPRVRRVLSSLVAGSELAAISSVAISIGVPIAMHHGMLPASPMLESMLIPSEARDHYSPPEPEPEPEPEDDDGVITPEPAWPEGSDDAEDDGTGVPPSMFGPFVADTEPDTDGDDLEDVEPEAS